MRVITGSVRGMRLQTLEGLDTRPTSEKVKEAVFSMLQFELEGRRFLDLYAGSGQMGIEALSRGAITATFVENSTAAAAVIKNNLKRTGFDIQSMVRVMPVDEYLRRGKDRYEVIWMDPPYRGGLLESTLNRLSEIDILSEGGIIVCERPADLTLPDSVGAYTKTKDSRYGRTGITVYRYL